MLLTAVLTCLISFSFSCNSSLLLDPVVAVAAVGTVVAMVTVVSGVVASVVAVCVVGGIDRTACVSCDVSEVSLDGVVVADVFVAFCTLSG